ncbi:zinc finger BED domain-containing protein 1-like [Copidosoma floridanum]|uniref:zinc finger BED domain-containing protein 1-like n=1 Tax=Copidosoma floridanum TaxID=29053 RepID=UPI0006C9927C|nr:zinc finger BED domain-containing protein 1-like [Copidosoma floridanum]XP_014214248.1 zinc finger BED domain-containing protein 1-like [Copidosoma floridanum]
MRSVNEEWGIEVDKVNGITTDGGANIKGAAKEVYGVNKHFSCMDHILNLIGSKALGLHGSKPRPSVTFFRKSEVATSELVKLQIEGTNKTENDAKRLINECRTRWSSGEAMCERFLELSDPVGRTLMKVSLDKSSRSVPPDMLTVSELSSLTDAQTLLRPLTLTTKSLNSAKTVFISKIIPMINSMQSRIQKFQPSTPVGFNLKQTLLDDIKKFFGNIERTSLYAAATLLDPRFKRVPFNSDVAIAEGMGYIAKLMNERMNAVRCEAEAEAETNRIFGGLDDPEQVAEPDDDSDDLLASFD